MNIIEIRVENKRAISPDARIINSNSDYQIRFLFDEEWDNEEIKTARFYTEGQYQEVVFSADICDVPVFNKAKGVFVGVYAGDLRTTTPAFIAYEESILSLGGAHEEPQEDVYLQLLKLIESSGGVQGEDGKSAYEIAVENGYSGTETEWLESLNGTDGIDGKDGINGIDGEDGITPHIGANGNWYIGTQDTGTKAIGTDGTNGKDGANGTDGKDGLTPYIGENGNWYIGETDTGVKAAGADGKDGQDGVNGIDGADGEDGITPHIGDNGNWFIGETDTGVKAEGIDGKDGVDGNDGTNGVDGKSAYEIAVENGFIGTETEWLESLKGADGQDATSPDLSAYYTSEQTDEKIAEAVGAIQTNTITVTENDDGTVDLTIE